MAEDKMTGRVILVTGASSGLGYEVARYLCEGGNDVILACRSEDKAKRAIDKIKAKNPNALATFMQLDLGELESIKKFVEAFHETGKKLHVLINNAGVALNNKDIKKQYTKDNFELTMGTNHLGHFLLTNMLLEDLKGAGSDGGDARVVTVTSAMHDAENTKRKGKAFRDLQPFDMENFFLFNENSFNGLQAYKNSKLANIMFTYELAKRLEGSGVTANCVCPGVIPSTDLMRNASGAEKFVKRYIIHGMLRFTKMTRTVTQGAGQICNVATEEKFKEMNGKYIVNGAEAKSSEESLTEESQKKLWELSGGYTQMEGYEPIEVPPPPVEEPPKEEEKKDEEKKEDGEATAAADGEDKPLMDKEDGEKTEENKEEEKKEEVVEEKKEEKKEEEEKVEEKVEEKTPESKEAEKAAEETKIEEVKAE